MSPVTRSRAARGAMVAAAALVAAGSLGAQQRAGVAPTYFEGPTPDQRVPFAKESAFNLFANADFAVAGLRMTGNFSFNVNNNGPISNWTAYTGSGVAGSVNANGGFRQQYIGGINFVAGVPISDFRKIRTVYPGVQNMRAPTGWSTEVYQGLIQGFPQRWGPADRSVGRLFSGSAVSTTNKACTDFSDIFNGSLLPNFQLLAVSDCPATWAPTGFDGPRIISEQAMLYLRDSVPGQGTNGFNFDFTKVPASRRGGFVGTVSTYGETSDTPSEILASYGSVTRIGSGNPSLPGFPIGLDIRFEAFQIARPQLASIVFYNMIVSNNSARVYGTGIDYDSLYMGLTHGLIAGGDQNPGVYYLPDRNAMVATSGNVSAANCNGARPLPGTVACGGNGALNGTVGIVFLKSPIGDERNKLLTTNGSAFFNPTSPFADDTITFNHGHICGLGCFNATYATNDRRGFGLLSSTASNVIDGRDVTSIPINDIWGVFRSKNYNGAAEPAAAEFNKYVPGVNPNSAGQVAGSWDWDGRPGQDTLYYDTCADRGCVGTFSDTMPGKQVNRLGNVGGTMAAGPFKLAAGDTTVFVVAFVGAPTIAQLFLTIDNARDAYRTFFAGPQPIEAPPITQRSIASAEVRFETGNNPQVVLRFSDAAERASDPYFESFARNIETSADPFFVNLRLLNPWLSDTLRGRALPPGTTYASFNSPGTQLTASGNLARLYIYRSCDGGQTFDATGDCVGDPLVNAAGGTVGLGWQPYFILDRDATGNVANAVTDNNVVAGRQYLYTIVTQTRGFSIPIVQADPTDASAACTTLVTNCRRIGGTLTVSDSLLSPLARSGPSTATVYVPISLPSGGLASSATVVTTAGGTTLPVTVSVGASPRPGTYRIVAGNRLRITERRVGGRVIETTAILEDTVGASRVGTTDEPTRVVTSETFVSPFAPTYVQRDTVFAAGTVSGDTVTRTTTLRSATGLILVLAEGAGPGGRILSVSTNRAETPTSTEFIGATQFPGFVATYVLGDTANIARQRTLQANGDSIQTGILNNSMAGFLGGSSRRYFGNGTYAMRFRTDVYGAGAPFTLQNPAQLEADVNTSLAGRTPASRTATGSRISQIILRDLDPAVAALFNRRRAGNELALVDAALPFTIERTGGPAGTTPVQSLVAYVRRDSLRTPATAALNTVLFGTGPDTARITVPATTWVPGDTLFVLDVVQRQQVTGGRAIFNADGTPVIVTDTVLAFGPFVVGCQVTRSSCNALRLTTPGATTYLPYQDGWQHIFEYPIGPTLATDVRIDVRGPTVTAVRLTKADLSKIRVVPNPYIVQSQYDVITTNQNLNVRNAESRIIFAGVPETGSMRIYTVSGQLVQQLRWTAADLASVNNLEGTGDLPYNLRTREGTDIASGLYIYVITAGGTNGGAQHRGKFVVIR